MNIFQPTQHIAVHLEDNLGEKFGSLLDCEWFVLESLKSIGTRQVEGDIGLSGCLNGERLDDACPWVIGVADGFTGVQAERSLPSVERFVVLIYADTVEVRYDILQGLKGTVRIEVFTKVGVLCNSLLLADLETLGLAGGELVVVFTHFVRWFDICVCLLFGYQVRTRASTYIKVSTAIRSSN